MQWMSKSDALNSTEWGWDVQRGKLVPLMMDLNPAPDKLLKMIHCNGGFYRVGSPFGR